MSLLLWLQASLAIATTLFRVAFAVIFQCSCLPYTVAMLHHYHNNHHQHPNVLTLIPLCIHNTAFDDDDDILINNVNPCWHCYNRLQLRIITCCDIQMMMMMMSVVVVVMITMLLTIAWLCHLALYLHSMSRLVLLVFLSWPFSPAIAPAGRLKDRPTGARLAQPERTKNHHILETSSFSSSSSSSSYTNTRLSLAGDGN